VLEAVRGVREAEPFAPYLAGWKGPWRFPSTEDAAGRLRGAGFHEVRCWLEPRTLLPEDPRAYLHTVTLRLHVERLPEALREPFVDAVVDRMAESVAIDYVRLNIDARRP
jgi:trans-aconitate 2-methyltransferase